MSRQSHDTHLPAPLQAGEKSQEEWGRVIEPLLPARWREQAMELGAWSRARKIKDPADLLRGLVLYAALSCSFRELGMWATLAGIGELSERAWRKRLEKSAAWIAWLVSALLRARVPLVPQQAGYGRVLLVDATHLAVLAGHGDDLRLHCAYDVLQANLSQVQVTDRHAAEQISRLHLQAGDVVVTDAGYVAARSVEYAQAQQAWMLQRFSARHVRLFDETGQLVGLKEHLDHQEYGQWSQHSFWLLLPESQQRVPVRVVAFRLPEAQALQAMERKAKRLRQQYGQKYSREAVWWAQWCLLLTTLPEADWDAQSLLDLYRARWQIELLFKRFKQSQSLHRLPFVNLQRGQIVVQLHLIVWIFQEHFATQLQVGWQDMQEEEERLAPVETQCEGEQEPDWPEVLSSTPSSVGLSTNQLLLMHVCLTQLQQIVRGPCPLWRLQAAWSSLQRYWGTRRRRRNQGPVIEKWVSTRLVAISDS